jgi:hypothetical protein
MRDFCTCNLCNKSGIILKNVRLGVLAAVTMSNAVFCHIKTQFIPHRKHNVSASESNRLILCAVTVKNAVFWYVTPCCGYLQEPHGVTSQENDIVRKDLRLKQPVK